MNLRAWVVGVGAAVFFVACNGSSDNTTTTTSSGTGGILLTGGGSTGGGNTTGPGTATTTTGTTTGEATTTTGGTTTGAGTTTSGTTTGGTTAGNTGTGTTTSGSGGTTGYAPGPPYSGFDAGSRSEPPIAAGCFSAAPFKNPGGGYPQCVACRTSADCAGTQKCDKTYQCVACRDNSDCDTGQVCETGCTYIGYPKYNYVCSNACVDDCRSADAGPDFCNPGLCDGDGGGCLTYECTENSQCVVDGQGACNFQQSSKNGYGTCGPCTLDAGGCGPDSFCVQQFGQYSCQLSCLVDAGVCSCAGQNNCTGSYCADSGVCTNGCQTSNDCIGSYSGPICHQGACVGCLNSANCPDYNAGCGSPYYGGSAVCGLCGSQADCPSNLHCENLGNYQGNGCGCHSDDECANYFLDAPTCVGLNASEGFPAGSGRCACTDSSQCPTGFVCETRYPFTITINNSGGQFTGGACITQCNLVGTTIDCATAGIGPDPNNYYPNGYPPTAAVCDSATGYCVSCAQDGDCAGTYGSATGPAVTPSCVQYPNGIDPGSGEPTGGGQCACDDTSQCNDGYACWSPGINGACKPPCSIVNGQDSCDPYQQYYYQPPTDPFCDSYTGACVQCLDDYGCTNVTDSYVNGLYAYPGFAAPICSPTGQCVGCNSDADCPENLPNCTQGFCGFCSHNSDCYVDAGFQCINIEGSSYYASQCLKTCVPNSDGTPSDAGFPCPASDPFCSTITVYTSYPNYNQYNICAQCRQDYGPPNYQYYGDCSNSLPTNCYYGYCEQGGWCYYGCY